MNTLPNSKTNSDLSIQEAASQLRISAKTLRRWEEKGILIPSRTTGGHRRYSAAQINSIKTKGKKIRVTTPLAPTANEPNIPQLYESLHKHQVRFLKITSRFAFAAIFLISSFTLIRAATPSSIRDQIMNDMRKIAGQIKPTKETRIASTKSIVEDNSDKQVLALTTASLDTQSFNIYVQTNINNDADISGVLNLVGNTIISADDLIIDPGGGGVSIGTGASSIDLAEGDFFVSDEVETGGSLTIGGSIILGGDTVSDLTGDGLQVTAGALQTILGNTIETAEITDGTIIEADLATTNTATDNQILSYDSATDTFTWVADESGDTSLFIDGGGVTYLTSETDDFAIGGTNSSAALFFDESTGDLSITGDLTVTGGDLTIGSILLDAVGTSNITSGASLVGIYDEFTNSNSTTIQDVLDDFDALIGTGVFTDSGTLSYLTDTTDALTIGGSTELAKFAIDGDTDEIQFLAQGNSTQTSNILIIEQSDGTDVLSVGNTGNTTLTDSGTSNIIFNLTSTGDFVIQDASSTYATFTDTGTFVLDSITLDGTGITSSGDLTLADGGDFILSGFDCTGNTNGGVLTADASGIVTCADDDGGSGGAGDITAVGDGTTGDVFTADGGGNTLYFEGSAADANEIILTAGNPGADYTVTLPDITGTLASLAEAQTFTGAKTFSGGVTNSAGEFLVSGGNLQLNDSINATFGTGDDLTISHNGTNSVITSATGDLTLDNTNTTGSTILQLGTDTSATDFQIQNNTGSNLLTLDASGSLSLSSGVGVSSILDEDTLVTDSATALATQQSIKAYVDAQVGGSSQNLFQTISTTSGTSPVADTTTDTLTLTAGSNITVTGDSGTDTVTIAAIGLDNYGSWTFAVDTVSQDTITSGDILDFTSGSGITVTRSADDQLTFTAADTSATNELQDLWNVFTADSGSTTANSNTDSLAINGGTNGIDTAISGDVLTLNLDTTEIGNTTFGSGSGFTWTFDASAGTDPTLAFGNDTLTSTVGSFTTSGTFSSQGNTIGLNNDADVDNLIGIAAAVGVAGSDLYWGNDLVCDVSETNCGWTTSASSFTSWTVADDDGDTYSIVDSNILRFTSSDSNVLTNLTSGDDADENLDFSIRLLGDAVAGAGLTGGANDVLVGADSDTTFDIGAGTGITVNASDVAVDETYSFAWTGQHSFTNTLTATGSQADFNLTLGNDADVDTISALNIDATSATTGDADNLRGLNISNLASADATVNEDAIVIGTGWDSILNYNGTTVIDGTGQLIASQLTGTLFSTSSDSGSSTVIQGDTLTFSGSGIASTSISGDTVTITATEAQNLFQTISTTSGTSPVADSTTDTLTFTAGSNITVTGDSGTDTVTIAATGLDNYSSWTITDGSTPQTISSGNTLTVADSSTINAATSATDTLTYNVIADSLDFTELSDALALDADTTITAGVGEEITYAKSFTNATTENGYIMNFTASDTTSGTTAQYGLYLDNLASTEGLDAIAVIDNSDLDDSVTTGLLFIDAGGGITTGIDLSDTGITTALDVNSNFLLFDGIRAFEGSTGTLTFEDTAGNDLLTLIDGGSVGNATITGTLSVSGTTIGINNDADSDSVIGQSAAAGQAGSDIYWGDDLLCDVSETTCGWVTAGGSGSSLFTDGGTITYLTSTTDDLAIGSTDGESELFFDTSAAALNLNPFGATAGNTGEIRFQELEASGDNYTGLKSPDSLVANVIYTLPTADATTNNQVLASNTSGTLSWIDVSAGSGGYTGWTLDGDDATTQSIDSGNTVLVAGGTNITTDVTATDTVTINLDDSITLVGDLAVNGDDITSDGDLTINPAGGQLYLADTAVFNVGGLTGVTYNAISDSGTANIAASDDDLYIEGVLEVDTELEVDGTLDVDGAADFSANLVNSAGELLVSGGNLQLNDSIVLSFGTSDDFTIAHGGTNTVFDNTFATGATQFQLGTDTSATDFQILNNSSANLFEINGEGLVTIAGSADGTDALVVTAGDILLSDGDFDLSGGDFNVTLDAGDGASFTASSTTVDALTITSSVPATNDSVDGLTIAHTLTDSNTSAGLNVGVTNADNATAADTFYGIYLNIDDNSTLADDTAYGLYINNPDQGAGTDADLVTDAQIVLNNSENGVAIPTGILFSATTGGGYTTGIDLSDTNITTALDINSNFLLFDGIRAFEGSTGTLTFEDTAGNDLATLTDNSNVGDLNLTGNLSVDGTTIGLNDDADADSVLGQAAAAGQAGADLYWGDDLVCDVSATNCGWATSGTAFTQFTVAGDSGGGQTITDSDTLTIAGGTNGIDTVDSVTDTVTLNLDTTEIGTNTFGSGSGITWTFDVGATDPTLAFASNDLTIGSAVVTVSGSADGTDALILTAGDILLSDGDLDISGGDFNVVLDAGDGVNISKGAASTTDVFSINGGTSATDGIDNLQLTFGVSAASGNVIDITPSYADATAGTTSETYNIIDIDAFTATQNATGDTGLIRGLNIGNLTQTETAGTITANALNIGTGWDSILDYNGTQVIDGTGQLVTSQLTGTLFSTDTDTGSANTIVQGDTLSIDGDTNGIDVTHSGDTITVAFDGTEVGAETWGTGSGFAWTFDVGATDPTLTFGSDSLQIGSALITIDGTAGSNSLTLTAGDTVLSDGSLSIIDADNAASLSVTNNTATTIGAGAAGGVNVLSSTSLTTGDLLELQLTEGTLTTGNYINAWDVTAGASVFSVAENGLTTIAGSADGTDALVLTTGDILVTDGNIDISDGDLNVTLGAGDLITIDAEATDNTGTTGIINLDLDSTSSQQAINLDIETITDAGIDTLVGLDILATQTSTDNDVVYGIQVQNLAGTPDAGNEYGIYQAGTAWDYGLYVEDDALFNTGLVVNGTTLGIDNDADTTDNYLTVGASGTAGDASNDLFWGQDLLCDVSETNCGWVTSASSFTSWSVADDDGDVYSIVNSNILRFTSSDSNVLTNLINGDDADENLDFSIRLLGDAVAGAGLTGGANDVLVGADSDTTFDIGAGTGITVNANDVAVNEDYDFTFTGNVAFTPAGIDDLDINLDNDSLLTIDQTFSGTTTANSTTLTTTNSSSSGTQNLLYLDNAASTGTTESLLVIDNSDTDTAVTNAIEFIDAGGGFTNLFNVAGTLISSSEFNILDGGIDLSSASEITGITRLTNGGTGASLADPNADRIFFWDDGAGSTAFLAPDGTSIEISGTTLQLVDGSSQASVNNSGTTVIQDVTLDTYGRVTGLVSTDLSSSLDNYASWTITDGTTPQTISSGNTLTAADSSTINAVTSATDTLTYNVIADSLDFTELADSLTLDAATTITNSLTGNLGIDLTSTGAFVISDNGNPFFTFDDDSTIDIEFPTAGQIVVDAITNSNTTTTGVFDLNIDAGNAAVIGIDINFIQSSGATTGTDVIAQNINLIANDADGDVFGISVTGNATANAGAGSYESLLRLVNAENTASVVTDAILIDSTSGTAGDIVDALDVSDVNITNALNIGANFALFDGIRAFEGSTGTLTFEDTAGNDLLTLVDAGTTGNLTTTGDIQIQGGDITTDQTTFNLINDTATTLNFGGAATTFNIAPTGASGSITFSGGSGDTGCTLDGTTGDLACAGDITGGSAGTVGFWTRSGTTLSPATAGDDISLPDSDTLILGTGSDSSITYDGTNLVLDPDLVGSGTVRIAGTAGADKLTVTAGDVNVSDGSVYITDDDNAASLSLTNNTATTIGAGINTDGLIDFSSTSLTTGNLLNLETTTSLTTGKVLNISSTSTALTTGQLIDLDWSPGSATTATGNLFELNIGANATVTGNLFALQDNGSDLFTVGQSKITSALPHEFTAAGDVTVAYDLVLSNQTASKIASYGPFTIEAGENFESNNLTFKTYNSGDIVFDIPATGYATFQGAVSLDGQTTFTDSDATPDVSGGSHFITNTATVTITDFDAGSGGLNSGHLVVVESAGAITYDVTSAGFNGGTTDIVTAAGDITTWMYDGTDWNLIAFMDDSDNQITGADLAEWYPSNEELEPGDVVGIDTIAPIHVGKTTEEYQTDAIGIVSTNPGLLLGQEEENTYAIALAGRVPVKIDPASPEISAGDAIAVSSVTGRATKATKTGPVIGKAMENWNPTSGQDKVMVFVNLSWYEPQILLALDESGNINLTDGSGNTLLSGNNINLNLTSENISLNGSTTVNGELIVNTDSTNLIAALSNDVTKFVVDSEGNTFVGLEDTTETNPLLTGDVCYQQVDQNGSPVYQLVKCEGAAADLAEWYPVLVNREPSTVNGRSPITNHQSLDNIPQPGEVVRIGNPIGTSNAFVVETTSESYDSKAIGIVSTQAHTIMGEDVLEWAETAVPVALAGRVPVKIDPESDSIETGDRLTSATNGQAKKATETGYTIGNALEAWNSENPTKTILVFIENSIYLDSNLASNDQTSNSNDSIDNSDLANSLLTDNSLIDNFSVSLETISDLITEIETDQTLMEEALGWELEGSEGDISITNLGTENLYVTGLATAESISISTSLVLGNDFVISNITSEEGNLIGTSINTIDAPLSIQGTASQPLSIMAGQVTVDTDGNVKISGNLLVEGNIKSETVTTNKLVLGTSESQDSAVSDLKDSDNLTSNSIGTATLVAGETSVEINTTAVTENSLVYLTPTSSTLNKVLYLKGKITCNEQSKEIESNESDLSKTCIPNFIAGIDGTLSQDIEFNWWIVDVVDDSNKQAQTTN